MHEFGFMQAIQAEPFTALSDIKSGAVTQGDNVNNINFES